MFSFLKAGHKRTIILALLATFTFVGSAIFMFDVDKKELLEFFIASVVGLGIVMLAALSVAGLIILLRKWLG